MARDSGHETTPLLEDAVPANGDRYTGLAPETVRAVEDDSIPESAVSGRHLTLTNAYILVISRIIGTAIFATPGLILKSAGSIGLSMLLWVFGAILAATDLVVWLEYGCMLPRSGGHKVYLEFTYPHPRFLASTLVAVQSVLLSFSVGSCVVFGKYMLFAFDIEQTDFRLKALSSGLMITVVIIHGCFHKFGVWLQDLIGWAKVFMIIIIALIGMYVVAFPQHGHLADTPGTGILNWDVFWKNSDWGLAGISAALFKVTYAYAGLNNANNVMNEVKNPVRTLKIVIPAGLITACSLYILVNLAYFFVAPVDEIKSSGELIAALFFKRVLGAKLGATVLPLVIALSAAGNVFVVAFGMGRVNQEVARQGFVPHSHLIASSRPFNAPLGGLIAHSIPSLLVILLSPSEDVYSFILDVESYPYQMMLLAIAIGILILRRERPDLKRPFKAWLPAVYIRILVCLVLLAAPFFPPVDGKGDVSFFYATYAIVGVGILLFAVLFWYVWTVYLPRRRGYRLEEKAEVLEDGTTITKLVRIDI